MSYVINAVDVQRRYRLGGEEVAALAGVSLQVERGAFIALAAATSYWFFTIPARYRANRERLARLVEK